jgi:YVTN family beta-propeller protein
VIRRPDRLETVAIGVVASITALLIGWTIVGRPSAAETASAAGASGMAGMSGMATSPHGGGVPVSPEPGAGSVATDGTAASGGALPGMPPLLDPHDAYAADRPGMLSPVVAHDPARIYVPNSMSDTVTVIDPATYRVIGTYRVGHEPQHVVPSWDLRTLWVNNDLGNSLTPIDPRTGRFGRPVHVHDPYNLYFTPNGRYAVVMASADRQLDFLDPQTMQVRKRLDVPCLGVNHADFSLDGRYFLVSCEFSGQLLKVDTERMQVVGVITLPQPSMPQDVKVAPDGHVFYVADMMRGGVWLVDGSRFRVRGFVQTGAGAHGEYVSRDSRVLYVSNRSAGSVTRIDLRTDRVIGTWHIPGGGSPDMGGLSADGRVLWLSGRYDGVVYAISTGDGRLLARIRVGSGPHGLCVFPQPGRYSLGHTGVFR